MRALQEQKDPRVSMWVLVVHLRDLANILVETMPA
jgi:hypothetical protein